MKRLPGNSSRRVRILGWVLAAVLLGLIRPQSSRGGETPSNPSTPDARIQSLDGLWRIVEDKRDVGVDEKWFEPKSFPDRMARSGQVPGNVCETWPNPAPIMSKEATNRDWYARTFVPQVSSDPNLRYYLRFGAVAFQSEVWLNGIDLGTHEGGQDPFEFDVTGFLQLGGSNALIVRVVAPYFGGINQHVTLVGQPAVRLVDAWARPDAAKGMIGLEVTLENDTSEPAEVELTGSLGEFRPARELGSQASRVVVPPGRTAANLALPVGHPHLWALEDPFLYTVALASRWTGAPTAASGSDQYALRTGFRDFRISHGYFYLNGKRIFLKSTHSNWYDPIAIQGTPRTMQYLGRDFALLKKAGFNTFRLIVSAALPEQLDQADEEGFLIYSEHETSWFQKDPTKFGLSLNQVVRRDRNHPSLVMWGLLNETASLSVYRRARGWLPSLRAVDDSRLVMLSSGRWDGDLKTASASNPGSSSWDVYLGGEDPAAPLPTGEIPEDIGAFHSGTGDAHVYQRYPTTWAHVLAFSSLAQKTKPFLLSESGDGSSYNPFAEKRGLDLAGAPADAYARHWVELAIAGLRNTWATYGLQGIYPSIEDMMTDSSVSAGEERERTFSYVRGNPRVNGFNLTSLVDCWGTGEGFLDSFREFKPGQLAVLQAGWAPLRWCLLVNPTHVYADRPLRIRVSFSNEDRLAGGDYPATLKITGAAGPLWSARTTVHVTDGSDAPFSCLVFDQDVELTGAVEGTYRLEASLDGRPNAAASQVPFTVTSRLNHPGRLGLVTLLGVEPAVRDLLVSRGAVLRDYLEEQSFDGEAIVVGGLFQGGTAAWRSLYGRIARGAHAVFLSPKVFRAGRGPGDDPLRWLALRHRGTLVDELEWLYHKDVVAKGGAGFAGLRPRLMTPRYYETVLADAPYFAGGDVPDETEAVAVRCLADGADAFHYRDGVMLGVYRHHAGRFTINGLNLLGNTGQPAADRLLLNLVAEAQSDAAPLHSLPADYAAELDALGIADRR